MSSRRIEHENYLKEVLSQSITSKNPSNDAYDRSYKESSSYFMDLKKGLLNKYEGKDLLDIEGSEVVETVYGETLKITHKEKINFNLDDKKDNLKKELMSNLKILPGIGINKEKKLKSDGYETLYDLLSHKSYGENAKNVISDIENECFVREYKILKDLSRYTDSENSRNNTLKSLIKLDPFNLKFMDIETMGLSNQPIILLGVAEIKGDSIESNQYLLRDFDEEPALIDAYLSHIDEASVHVTFNGASFDIPFIKNRAKYYRIAHDLDQIHFDLMYPARNLWKGILPDCKLTTIEEYICGITREDDVPGAYVPDYYRTYREKHNIGPLIPIIDHNRMDIISLASFLMRIYEESFKIQ